MLFQTICTEASTLTSSIDDTNAVAPCRETLILVHLDSLVIKAAVKVLLFFFKLLPICYC